MSGERTGVWAHCPTCGHEWLVLVLPMSMDGAAERMATALCPMGSHHLRPEMARRSDVPGAPS